jgi:transglutaminase-like putative cysteine protease
MLIRLGYTFEFDIVNETPMVAMLHVHPSRAQDLLEPDALLVTPEVPLTEYIDSFGNRCTRFLAPPGKLSLRGDTLIRDSGELDELPVNAIAHPIQELPPEVMVFLLSSRYCEVDLLSTIAFELFGQHAPGWPCARAIQHWVNEKVRFGYHFARSTRTALETYTERVGVCRDFQHLAIAFCRAMNIPARYSTGYLGDIGVPYAGEGDFSAWFEIYLGDRWWTMDARHNKQRIGRVLMAVGRDAADVALTTSFGVASLKKFHVVSDEVQAAA